MSLGPIEACEARILSLRLGYGFCELDQIEDWATRLIERIEQPPHGLLQLGLARLNGVSLCLDAFAALDLGAVGPWEVLIAVASAEPARLEAETLEPVFEDIWLRSLRFESLSSDKDKTAIAFLDRAFVVYDAYAGLKEGTLSAEGMRAIISDYVGVVRNAVARAGAEA